MPTRSEPLLPADAGPVERPVRPRAWCVPTVGGDYLRSHPSLPNNGDPPMSWEPLYDSAALKAAVAAERERVRTAIEAFPHWLGPQAKRELLAALFGPNVGDERPARSR